MKSENRYCPLGSQLSCRAAVHLSQTCLIAASAVSPLKQSLLLVLDSFLLLVRIDGQQFVIYTPQKHHNIHNLNSINALQIFHFSFLKLLLTVTFL